MRRRRFFFSRAILLAFFLCATFSGPAMAKTETEKLPPYDVTALPHHRIWVPWIFGFLFGTASLLVAFKNPHRTTGERG